MAQDRWNDGNSLPPPPDFPKKMLFPIKKNEALPFGWVQCGAMPRIKERRTSLSYFFVFNSENFSNWLKSESRVFLNLLANGHVKGEISSRLGPTSDTNHWFSLENPRSRDNQNLEPARGSLEDLGTRRPISSRPEVVLTTYYCHKQFRGPSAKS